MGHALEPALAHPRPDVAQGAEPERADRLWDVVRGVYLTMDRRTLGLTRVLLGFYLICDLFRRTGDWTAMFSSEGVLPPPLILSRPQADNFSLFHAFSTPGELWALWAVGLATYVALLVGYKTKVAQVVAFFFVTSMNGRVLLIENGGYVVQNLLVLWTAFLPLGDRFSVDALVASMRRRREARVDELDDRAALDEPFRAAPFVSLASFAVLLQLAAIYFFNVVHKTGPAWQDGTAVHYVLFNDRMATPIVPLVRTHLPFPLVVFMTKTTMVFESALPLCLLSPIAVPWARRAVVFMMCTLHIAFGTVFTLGPFAWACCVFSTLMFTRDDWELAAGTLRREARARTVLVPPGSALSLWIARLVARLDRLELLAFAEAEHAAAPFEVVRASGARVTGADALADVLAALPLGPLVAWVPRLPLVRRGVARAFRACSAEDVDASLGLVVPSRAVTIERGGRVRRAAAAFVREALVALMLATAVNQALVELWVARPLAMKQPQPFRSLAHEFRLLQGWFMFSPNPVMDDGILVCDAVTAGGRHVDPFTGKPPTFVLDGHVQFSQIWQDYMNRIQLPANAAYRDAMKAWLLRYHERTGRPEDRVVAARVVWVHELNPRIGKTEKTNHEEREILKFDARADTARR
ncbi:MAG TPA: HTTM domain-containing protein [Minicystis sp.]|nr:HTTM domain-containing protein [Minicystis sp.]